MGVGARGMKSLVDYCKGPDEKQCQNQGHGHMVRRRSEALWENGDIVGGWGHCGRSEALWENGGIVGGWGHCGRSEALWEDGGTVGGWGHCGRSKPLWREKDRT